MIIFALILVLFVGGFVYVMYDSIIDSRHRANKYRRELLNETRNLTVAKIAYEKAISQLTKSPNSPNARKTALELGRYYASLNREDKNVTMFDEVALKNDIDAACAGATTFDVSHRVCGSESSDVPVLIKFRCEHCDKAIAAPSRKAGRFAKCPNCFQPMMIPLLDSLPDSTIAAREEQLVPAYTAPTQSGEIPKHPSYLTRASPTQSDTVMTAAGRITLLFFFTMVALFVGCPMLINTGGNSRPRNDGMTRAERAEHGRQLLTGEASWFEDPRTKNTRGSNAWYENPDVKYSDKVIEFSRGKTWDDFK